MNLRRPPDLVVLAASALLTAAQAFAALDASAWKFRQTFEVPAPGIVKLVLPVETLDLSRPNLADLRVLGPSGDEIPYLADIPADVAARTAPAQRFQVRLTRAETQITLTTGTEAAIDSILLATNAREFVKPARIEISDDGTSWQTLADGAQLARTSPDKPPALALGGAKAAHVRITLDDWRSSPVAFTGAQLLLASSPAAAAVSTPVQIVKRDEFLGETVLTLDLGARNLPLADLEIETPDALFSREIRLTQSVLQNSEPVEHLLAAGRISRATAAPGDSREALRLPVNATSSSRPVSLHLLNGDNAPLRVSKIQVRRRPVAIVFHASAPGAHSLVTGHPLAAAPRYDVARFARELTQTPASGIAVSAAHPNPHYRATDRLSDVPLLGGTLDPKEWKHRKPVETSSAAGVQELELDLEVLSRAQPSLADLRLVSGDRQAPFLLERTALLRAAPLTIEAADDPAKPRLSRWKLTLPPSGAAIERLTLDSSAALFSREVRLYEIAPDSRGEPRERLLTSPISWTRAPQNARSSLALAFHSRPQSEFLFVEIDNGDNPPIPLTTASAAYPVIRLLFRAPDTPLDLLYGNPAIRAPSYDLVLMADQFVRDDRALANLGAEISAPASATASFLRSARSGVLLWVSLAAVVAVLLVVIARLLPKTPPAS